MFCCTLKSHFFKYYKLTMQKESHDIDKIGTDTYEVSPVPSCYSSDDDLNSRIEIIDTTGTLNDKMFIDVPVPTSTFTCKGMPLQVTDCLTSIPKKSQKEKLK